MAAVLPTEYLSMNHSRAWKLTLLTMVLAVVVEYSTFLLLYQTTCTKFNTNFILTFKKFNIISDAIEFKEKPATMWAHAASGVIPITVKFIVFLWKKKRFQGKRIRNNIVVPLYQCKQTDSKTFLNISEYTKKNFNPVQLSIERDIDLVDTDKNDMDAKPINQTIMKHNENLLFKKMCGKTIKPDNENIELGIIAQKEKYDTNFTKPSFFYTYIDENKRITCNKPDISVGDKNSCNTRLGLDHPELTAGGSMAPNLVPRREIEHLRISSSNTSSGSSGNLNPKQLKL